MLVELAVEEIEETIRTAHNKRFSEMAVDVETSRFLLLMTLCGSSGHGAPNPPLRQAAGRYVQYTLVRWNLDGVFFLTFFTMQIIYIK